MGHRTGGIRSDEQIWGVAKTSLIGALGPLMLVDVLVTSIARQYVPGSP
jgi:hypothetical protein